TSVAVKLQNQFPHCGIRRNSAVECASAAREDRFRTAAIAVAPTGRMTVPVTTEVGLQKEGEIAVITVDNPPVNALKQVVRAGLLSTLTQARDDAVTRAIVLVGAGRTFIVGADITEFGKPSQPPSLPEIIGLIENSPKPVIAAMHGTPLGGGLELTLACHFRIAAPGTRLGLPEIKLGLIPGAGGTQRLPRLVGMDRAMAMILSGEPVP